MSVWAVIPVKQLHESKRRLAHVLSAEARADLIYNFLDRLLITLDQVPAVERVLVVTADPAVMTLATRRGAAVIREESPAGLNEAVGRAAEVVAVAEVGAMLVLPADLPFARAEDIQLMLQPLAAAAERPMIAICGDETADGTNALLLSPPDGFIFHYGPGSYRLHVAEAARRGRAAHIIHAPGLRFDLDTESDWFVYNGYLVEAIDE